MTETSKDTRMSANQIANTISQMGWQREITPSGVIKLTREGAEVILIGGNPDKPTIAASEARRLISDSSPAMTP